MKRPEVTLENYQAVFDYYDQRGPNTNFAHLGHLIMRRKFHPQVTFAAGAEQLIADRLRDRAQVILVTNHDSDVDQFNLASFVSTKSVFRPMVSNTVIMAKTELFKDDTKKGRRQRIAIDELGAFPVFRKSDVEGEEDSPERELQRKASESSIQLALNKTGGDNNRYHLAGFPEGRRTLVERKDDDGTVHPGEDHTVVRTISRGFGLVYANLLDLDDREVIVVSAGMAYGREKGERDMIHPTVYIGQPITGQVTEQTEFNELLRANMQRDLTAAYDLRDQRPPQAA